MKFDEARCIKSCFCNPMPTLPKRSLAPSITFSWHRLFNQKSPLFGRLSPRQKKSDCPHTILSGGERGKKNAKPSFRMWMYVDVWSRVMLLQFPSGRIFCLLLLFFIIFFFCGPHSVVFGSREEENCVFFGHSFDVFFFSPPRRVFSHSIPPSVSEYVVFFVLLAVLDPEERRPKKKSSGHNGIRRRAS